MWGYGDIVKLGQGGYGLYVWIVVGIKFVSVVLGRFLGVFNVFNWVVMMELL